MNHIKVIFNTIDHPRKDTGLINFNGNLHNRSRMSIAKQNNPTELLMSKECATA